MTRKELVEQIKKKRSFLCVGLDTDLKKIPRHLHSAPDPILEFNKQIIDATKEFCVAYKPNTAFYEALGSAGWEALEKTVHHIEDSCKDVFIIADAKRGDMGNTAEMYAQAFFGSMNVDAVTISPYLGEDTVRPFLNYEGKWTILLALTSNKSATDFQKPNGLYKNVLERSKGWGSPDNMMYVVGATQAEVLSDVRKIVPEHFLLVPGVGAQGGSLNDVAQYGMNKECGLLVNSSRNIIYASAQNDFALKAKAEAEKLQKQMEQLLASAKII